MCSVCRMEETVRSLLQNQGVLEQTAVDTVDIMKAYKVKDHCCGHSVRQKMTVEVKRKVNRAEKCNFKSVNWSKSNWMIKDEVSKGAYKFTHVVCLYLMTCQYSFCSYTLFVFSYFPAQRCTVLNKARLNQGESIHCWPCYIIEIAAGIEQGSRKNK